ncbi:MAG: VWA domain-containing protein [Methylococcaceae bacterium]|nr:MAG: VWA domain-containing protein [Methylococcaceae bacterium]
MAFIARLPLLLLFCLGISARAEDVPPPTPSADVRILIDVSGSMKKTDPLNLRAPALRLLISLLPADAQASLWLFAEEPKLLLPLGKTDVAWKRKALNSSGRITSNGLFTHIEAALNQASEDWKNATALAGKRHLILLTDGKVDISKEAEKSTESRQRILSDVIPRLQQLGVQVHTVALSGDADHELLKKLSQDSGGSHEAIEAAEQLERMFAKVVSKATPHDTVPLQGNKFTIDPSIQEFSLLVFLGPNAEPTRLVLPNKMEASEIMLLPNIHWRHEAGYDLITVDHPDPGAWELIAKTDPDNQVMVVTDLKLVVKDLPNYLTTGETINISAHFTDQEGTITKDEFLKLIDLRLRHNGEEQALSPDAAKPGYFSTALKDLLPGKHTLSISADGKTFKREINHSLEVVEQLVASKVSVDVATMPQQLIVALTANKDLLDVKNTRIMAKLSNAYGQSTDVAVPGGDGVWTLKLPLPSPQELLTINFSVIAKTLQGKDIKPSVSPLVLNSQTLAQLLAPAPEKAPPPPEPVPAPEKKPEPVKPPPAEPKQAEETHEAAPSGEQSAPESHKTSSWVFTGIAVIVINLIVIAGGWFGYRAYVKRSTAKRQALLNELAPIDTK